MKFGSLLLAFLLACPITACVWVKGTTKNATRTTVGGHPLFHLKARLQRSIELDLRDEGGKMEEALRGKTGFDDRNDYSVALMFLGRASEAVVLLEQLELEKPGDYATAANLGTAYELAGRNQDAKRWIDEAIRRNPDSHDGTEWLHAEILNAKIQQDRDPLYFKNHSVLNIDYRALATGAETVQINGRQLTVKKLVEALEYQLTERLKFVKGGDPVVASLLFDLAALEGRHRHFGNSHRPPQNGFRIRLSRRTHRSTHSALRCHHQARQPARQPLRHRRLRDFCRASSPLLQTQMARSKKGTELVYSRAGLLPPREARRASIERYASVGRDRHFLAVGTRRLPRLAKNTS
jgi:tetratricopeptide (TPR) repeat protein